MGGESLLQGEGEDDLKNPKREDPYIIIVTLRRGVALTNVRSEKGRKVCIMPNSLQHYNHLTLKIITVTDREQG